ncbi:MAG: Gfo/Idh/MocA family oxidoreductase [Mesorhizobium sp.]|uniref:Gfo/Idh/MocA family protein n=1 Tax=Mesorhizobium sp. TaxID=1871066 RepID=UPI000FE853D7|nr:Gfo/Idh/MocA family oxidoreductase [Mesorhizobium sp.]RWD38587.1 MAG: Gfo/Idh/MocA family oxidoreductase [Mesorhizobium sp.]RWD83666.1 MAG: Gfo/Idh/MocA family oxidoreductase [Mesorhizobium sp.]RWE69825.1 MAG: Gfo/Idh/MocA family oxidoreductase [Mesorhizobium sp.]RWF01425.1 MAG: Gfo/Idh/MocA family oxidoreductase [Mesorhizobium sp.]TIS38532.1 MAG: Gfo/Idh/MocA family oxidoreductase [Mesorhizobium sp.]
MIGIGIIGAGDFGAAHARAIKEVHGLHLVASCRGNNDALAGFTAEHGGRGYTDWRKLLDDKDVDAVLIASPHHLHAEMAIGASEAGKHIMLEKPMAPTAAACDAINAAVAAGGVKLMVAHLMHFALPCMAARQMLEEGALGRPLIGSSWIIKLWMEHNRRDWHLRKATGGGMLLTAGIHALDRLVWLMDDDVVSVSAMLGAKFHDQEADDTALLGLRFAGGGLGQVQSVGYRNGATTYAMDLVCERGTLRIDMDRGTMLGRDRVWTDLPGSFEPNWMHNALVREWSAMRDAIADDRPVPVDSAYGRKIIGIIEAAFASNETRREHEIADAR